MKQTLLLAIALVCSLCGSAQSLTPTVIATVGFGYSSPELQVDMTVGETFITTFQTPEVILTQGFHQPVAQQGGGCINAALINPDVVCPAVIDPVCGCNGVTYDNSCLAQNLAGVTSWTPGACVVIPGCLSEGACNYNPEATQDDGTCLFIGFPCDDGNPETVDLVAADCTCQGEIEGCTDPDACNYDPIATADDFSCIGPGGLCDDGNENTVDDFYNLDCVGIGYLLGCINPDACNYNAEAGVEDGSCFFVGDVCDDNDLGTDNDLIGLDCNCAGEPNGQTPGCTAAEACNYNVAATIDDGSCTLPGEPCDDGDAMTGFDMLTADCACVGMLMGCTEPMACNYNMMALLDDGSCIIVGDVCDDGDMMTINDVITLDCFCQGQVVNAPGCTDVNACNYNSAATIDDGSCFFVGDLCDDGNTETQGDIWSADCVCSGEIVGCTAMSACNYNPNATLGDFSCVFPGDACDDGNAETFNDVYGFDCTCAGEVLSVPGCTDPTACNYDMNATTDDGSCLFVGASCDDGDINTNNDVYNANCECEGVVSVEELQANINLYPNPASTEVIVTVNGLAPTEVQIFDATGRFVMNTQRTSRIDIHTLAAGVYTFRVMQDGGVWEQHVIKK